MFPRIFSLLSSSITIPFLTFTTIPCLSVPPFLPHSGAMPDPGQQSQQNNQLELQ
jgi:hypothetical protein